MDSRPKLDWSAFQADLMNKAKETGIIPESPMEIVFDIFKLYGGTMKVEEVVHQMKCIYNLTDTPDVYNGIDSCIQNLSRAGRLSSIKHGYWTISKL